MFMAMLGYADPRGRELNLGSPHWARSPDIYISPPPPCLYLLILLYSTSISFLYLARSLYYSFGSHIGRMA